jgi:dihydrofolate synthase/folylpolyglutamate synthase
VIRIQAKAVKAPLVEICGNATIRNKQEWGGCYTFDLHTPRRVYRKLRLSLAGEHQTRNAALAVIAIEALKSFPIKIGDIRSGLANTRWLGRLDEYESRRRTLLDGAHNPESAQLLNKHLTNSKESEIHFVFGAMRDKDIREMGWYLFPLAASIHLTPIANSRCAEPGNIARLHQRFAPRMRIHSDMRDALRAAWKECSPSGLVVVTGSLYLVGNLLPMVRRNELGRAKCRKP